MKGYRRPAKVYSIAWDEGDLAGLHVRVGGLSVGKMLELTKAAAEVPEDFSGSVTSVEPLIEAFAEKLSEWNLEDEDGNPVPATLEGVRQQDLGLVIPVIMRWMSAVADIPAPLPGTSNSGGTSPEGSLQLANSSENLRNS